MKLLKSLMLGLILVFAMNTVVFAENLGSELKDEHTIIYDGAFILEADAVDFVIITTRFARARRAMRICVM